MALVGFNIVLAGNNFPVERIKAEDFRFDSAPLHETFRVPVALTAEAPGVNLQVLPNRLQASVTEVPQDAIPAFARHLSNMVTPFLDLVGTRSLVAVGHNAQFTLGGSGDRTRILNKLLTMRTASAVLGHSPHAADVYLYNNNADGSMLRIAFLSQSESDSMVMDFNNNFDLVKGNALDARSAVKKLSSSLTTMQEIANRAVETLVAKGKK